MPPRIDRIAIVFNTADLDRTERFYTEHLGLAFDRIPDEHGGAFLLTKIGNEVELMVFPGEPKPGNTPIVVFGLPDGGIDTLVESLAAAGVEIVTPVSEAAGPATFSTRTASSFRSTRRRSFRRRSARQRS